MTSFWGGAVGTWLKGACGGWGFALRGAPWSQSARSLGARVSARLWPSSLFLMEIFKIEGPLGTSPHKSRTLTPRNLPDSENSPSAAFSPKFSNQGTP